MSGDNHNQADPPDLDAIEARTEGATPGPWEESALGSEGYAVHAPQGSNGHRLRRPRVARCGHEDWDTDKANAEFIAHAREDVPNLAAALTEALEAIRLTQEYAQLPCVDGWSWWDFYRKHRPEDAERLRQYWERYDSNRAGVSR